MRENGRLGPHKAPAGRFIGPKKSPSAAKNYRKGKGRLTKRQRRAKRGSHVNKCAALNEAARRSSA